MIVAADLPAAVGNTPLIRLRRASEATGCEIWGKAEFMNPGQSVKDRAALWIIRDAVARGRAPARRHHRRGHRRQHRHRARADRRGDGVSHRHRHPGHPEPGEEGHDPPRRAPSSSRCRRCPTATRTTTCATPGRLAEKLAAQRSERRGLGEPVRQRREPPGACRRARRRRSGSRPAGRIDGFICAVGSGGTLAGVAEGLRARDPRGADRPRRSRRARRSGTTTPTAALKAEGSRSPRASARGGSPPTSRG